MAALPSGRRRVRPPLNKYYETALVCFVRVVAVIPTIEDIRKVPSLILKCRLEKDGRKICKGFDFVRTSTQRCDYNRGVY